MHLKIIRRVIKLRFLKQCYLEQPALKAQGGVHGNFTTALWFNFTSILLIIQYEQMIRF